MPSFSETSLERLDTVHPDLQGVAKAAIEIFDFTVIEGHRSLERQKQLLAEGKTQVRRSKHNDLPARAVDLSPYPVVWKPEDHPFFYERFYFLAGIMLGIAADRNIEMRWGGDWNRNGIFEDNRFDDLVHFELMGN